MNIPVDPGWLDSEARLNGPFLTAVAIFLVVWFTMMAVTGWLAARKNREGGLWAAVAFFLGPIALLAVVLLPKREQRQSLSPLWEQLEQREPVNTVDPAPPAPEGGAAV
ncbi:MAG TPA: hypothetical protein VHR16_07205 [Candidatus Limnocylindrales bacterium]|nr:hypothetical protein [Candidatus Limnocylindrales bacterium]